MSKYGILCGCLLLILDFSTVYIMLTANLPYHSLLRESFAKPRNLACKLGAWVLTGRSSVNATSHNMERTRHTLAQPDYQVKLGFPRTLQRKRSDASVTTITVKSIYTFGAEFPLYFTGAYSQVSASAVVQRVVIYIQFYGLSFSLVMLAIYTSVKSSSFIQRFLQLTFDHKWIQTIV